MCNHSLTFAPVEGHLLMQRWFSIVGVEGDNHPACHTHLLSLGPPLEEDIRFLPDLVNLAINCECHLLKGLKQVTQNLSNAPWGQKSFWYCVPPCKDAFDTTYTMLLQNVQPESLHVF